MSRRSGPAVCGRCGRTEPLAKRPTAEHPDLCKRCYRAEQPKRVCGICGKTRAIRIRARAGFPDICYACAPAPEPAKCGICGRLGRIARKATATTPQVGRCCYQPPLARCSRCGHERPCYHASSSMPVCLRCRAKPVAICLDCGEARPAYRRVDGGVLCAACDRRRGNTTGVCRSCQASAPLKRGLCAACRLRERVAELAARGEPEAVERLAPYLATLAAARNPASTLRWLQTPTRALLEELLARRLAISHAAFDALEDAGRDGRLGFLRAALVESGVLERRDEESARFVRWYGRAIDAIRPGPDRAHVRAYATWQVAHELAGASARGRATRAPQKHARALVSEAIKLVVWLHEQGLELRDLRQDLVDSWVAAGASQRRCVRLFLRWLGRTGVTGELEVAWHSAGQRPAPLDDLERFAAVRRLLHDGEIDRRDRFAGLLLLLYAQPLTRTAALRTSDVTATADGQVSLRLARGAVPLPEPLATLASALRDARLTAGAAADGWLLPGRKAGTHLSAEQLRVRLTRYGITSRPSRQAALLALAARLPAPILAERFGFHQSRAADWVRAAGATYVDYVALRQP